MDVPNCPAKFILARKIPGVALLYLADDNSAQWLRDGNHLETWANEWERVVDIVASFNIYKVERMPVSEDITSEDSLGVIESMNSMEAHSIKKAR